MQIFTVEQIIQMRIEAKEAAQMLFGSIIDTAWQSIIDNLGSIISLVQTHDWSGLLMAILIIISCIMLLYRLMRNNVIVVLKILLDH